MKNWQKIVLSVLFDGVKSWWSKRQADKVDKEKKDGHLP